MTVNETMLGRTKKLLRVKFGTKTGSITTVTSLGSAPIGFSTSFIQSEFRVRLNDWFQDLINAFPAVTWDEGTTVGEVIADVLDRSKIPDITKVSGYRAHADRLAEVSLNSAAGADAQSVPVARRATVQKAINTDLHASLLRNISLDSLAGDRGTMLANIVDRMVV